EMIYADPGSFNGFQLALGTLFFAFQIYCDFSGYSDIAIGTARLFGIELMTNFRTPYFSSSIREFWTRWHISLSSWFRDYVYIGLGGNKVKKGRWIFNILSTFTISGLWHGANFTFIIWGALHGFYYLFEQILHKVFSFKIPRFISVVWTFVLVNIAWVFFRAENTKDAFFILKSIASRFEFHSVSDSFYALFGETKDIFYIFPSLLLFLLLEFMLRKRDIDNLLKPLNSYWHWIIYFFITLWIIVFGSFGISQEFIYFQF
ncbi:MBOAT family O-acyltransferase, partial [Bacteroidota bacterium]